MHVLAVAASALGVPETRLIRLLIPHEKRWFHMEILAFLLEATLLLEAADPGCLLVLAPNCNVKKMVEQDLCMKRIVNFTSFFFHRGWSAVNGQRVEVKCSRKQTLQIVHD